MATTYKILAQSNPAATTETDVYTVGADTSAVISSILLANRSSSTVAVRVYIAQAGAVTSDEMYILYDYEIPANEPFEFTVGITLAETDVLRAYVASQDISINVFGKEIT